MTTAVTELRAGDDFRRPELRREVFQRFYTFQLRYRSHPGGVYYVLPHMAEVLGWDEEERAWAAFLQGNTQNPVTTLLLMSAGNRPQHARQVISFWREHYAHLAWDTDRRYHKARLADSIESYLAVMGGEPQATRWARAAADGWGGVWRLARSIKTMGRLSAWSYLEYVKLLGVGHVPDADSLMLGDLEGSRSHRNGLALVTGHDDWMAWKPNPGFALSDTTPEMIAELTAEGEGLLAEAAMRNPDHPDLGYLTLESALCTFKSWHRPRRRYPNVYNDLLHDRLRLAERRWGWRFDLIWDARLRALPPDLRLEVNPLDPGAVPVKQNWFLTTGQVLHMDRDWPEFANGWAAEIADGRWRRS